MARRLHGCLLGVAALMAASCYSNSDEDDEIEVADGGATASDAAARDAAQVGAGDSGVRRDGGGTTNNCAGISDPLQALLCSFGGGLLGGRDGGSALGGLPTAAQCRTATDPITQAICSFTNPSSMTRRDAGAPPVGNRDAGMIRRDAGPQQVIDAAVRDAAVQDAVVQDAASPVVDSAVEDAAAADSALPDAATEDAALPDAGPSDDASVSDGAVDDAAVPDAS